MKQWGQQQTSSLSGAFSNIGAGLAAGFTTALGIATKFYADATSTIKELAAQGKAAASIGISSDLFQGLVLDAKRFGIEGQHMFSMLTRLSAHVEEAKEGNTKFAKTLQNVGINMNEVVGKDPGTQFTILAEAISKLPNQGAKAAAAMEIFGKEGGKMLPILAQGKKGLNDFIAAQKELGNVQSPEEMKSLQAARAALPKLAEAMTGLWNKVVVAAAPVIQMIAGGLSQGVKELGPLFKFAGDAASSSFFLLKTILDSVWEGGKVIIDGFRAMGSEWGLNVDSFKDGGNMALNVFQVLAKAGAAIGDAFQLMGGVVVHAFGMVIDGLGKVLGAYAAVQQKLADTVPMGEKLFGQQARDMKSAADATQGFGQSLKDWGTEQTNHLGDGPKAVDAWFDKLRAKWEEKKKNLNLEGAGGDFGPEVPKVNPVKFQASAAMQEGSKEALSTIARFKFEGLDSDTKLDLAKKGNQLLKDNNAILEKILDKVGDNPQLGVV